MKKLDFYLKSGQIVKDKTVTALAQRYLEKSRNNLVTMNLLSDMNKKKARELLKIPKDYDSSEWVVICGYYAMYSAALSLIASIGFRSKNHSATIEIIEKYFVKDKHLDEKDLLTIKNAMFQKEEIEKLSDARHKREIAQYSVTKQTTRKIAEKIKLDSYSFVDKVDSIIKNSHTKV